MTIIHHIGISESRKVIPAYLGHSLRRQDIGAINESYSTIDGLLHEVAGHIRGGQAADVRMAFEKLQRIASLATTLAFTLKL